MDSSGGETLRKALDVVRPGGRIVVYGGTNGDATIKTRSRSFGSTFRYLVRRWEAPQDFAAMLELFRKGLRPVVDRVFPLQDAAAAMQHLANADQFGKVVLRID